MECESSESTRTTLPQLSASQSSSVDVPFIPTRSVLYVWDMAGKLTSSDTCPTWQRAWSDASTGCNSQRGVALLLSSSSHLIIDDNCN